MKIDIEFIEDLSEKISAFTIKEGLSYLRDEFEGDIAMTTAGGYSGVVLMSYLKDIIPDIPIFFIDTGYHFKETLDFIKKIKKEWKLNIIILEPIINKYGLSNMGCKDYYFNEEMYKANPNLCCHYLKVEPLLRVLNTKKIWLSSIRRDQSMIRDRLNNVEVDGRGVIKIYPFLNFSRKVIWDYIKKNNLPYNKLYDQGYKSIGCKPCTDKTDNDERDGRWKSCMKLECGVNL